MENRELHLIMVGGRERTYETFDPAPGKTKPVVFALHGGGGADISERTCWNEIAEREGLLMVYPCGMDGQWNDGRGKTFRQAKDNTQVDDTAFISAILDELIASGRADARKVYVVGVSNGGMMTYRLGIEMGHRIAAVAAIVANLPANLAKKKPIRPLPILIMNGTDDPMMPWNGGQVRVLGRTYGEVLSTEQTVNFWKLTNGLPELSQKIALPDVCQEDSSRVILEKYENPPEPVEVWLYRVEGGGHNLPGEATPDRPRVLGIKNRDIRAMEKVWEFFRRHSLPSVPACSAKTQDEEKTTTSDPVRIGDPRVDYANVEFTSEGRFMVWFEREARGAERGVVWHCGIDPSTGDLVPPDGRGFRAFESTIWARANPGSDADGPFYVGADLDGYLILVRPTGPKEGKVTRLSTAPDTRRRAIYPTILPHSHNGFLLWIKNEKNAGAGTRRNSNAWIELQCIDLANPHQIITVEQQETPSRGFAPMDVGFVRWMKHRAFLTYGFRAEDGCVELRGWDATSPTNPPTNLVVDGVNKIDPNGLLRDDGEWILAGVQKPFPATHIYRRGREAPQGSPFTLWKKIELPSSPHRDAALVQSHEPFIWGNRFFSVYQVNDLTGDFFKTSFESTGEIWLVDLQSHPIRQWRISPEEPASVSEPEPLVCGNHAWIFFNVPVEGPSENRSQITKSTLEKSASFRPLQRLGLYRVEILSCQ